ncbi:MAG: hypothetical protein AB7K71_03290 [Polyangiaceae bacterium]
MIAWNIKALRSHPPIRSSGARASAAWATGLVLLSGLALGGCGNEEETRTLNPEQVGMTPDIAPVFDDGETQLYEVKLPVRLPVRKSTQTERQSGRQNRIDPYDRYPSVTTDDYEVQVTWVISNLDDQTHTIELLLDPWNEFGRYWPGLQVVDAEDGEVAPNLSGIDFYRELKPSSAGEASRLRGTFTFDDMTEVTTDLAAVMNIILLVPPPPPDEDSAMGPATFANHAFHMGNRTSNTPLTDRYVPPVIAGLTGFDIGFRTTEPSNIALEFVVEIKEKDRDRDKVLDDGESMDEAFAEPGDYITVSAM